MTRLVLAAMAACVLVAPAGAQMSMTRADGELIPIGGGRIAVLKTEGGAVVVDGVVANGAEGAGADLRRGDQVAALQGQRVVALDSMMVAYRAIAVGAEVTIGVVREGRDVVVRFPKAAAAGRAMAVSGGAGAGAGAWVTSGADASAGMSIAGARIRENDQGMPEVSHRESHAASATVALRVGDVITAVDGRTIAALAGLQMLYDRIAAGVEVKLSVKRGNQTLDITFPKPAAR